NNGIGDACDGMSFARYTRFVASESTPWSLAGQAATTIDPLGIGASGFASVPAGVKGGVGSIVFDPVSPDPAEAFVAEFFARGVPGSGIPGEGFSFVVYDPQLHGGGVPFGEEGLGVGSISLLFDTLLDDGDPSGNHVELLYNGQSIGIFAPNFPLADGGWFKARFEVSGGKASLLATPAGGAPQQIFFELDLPGFVPFQAAYGFGGRSGGTLSETQVTQVFFESSGPGVSPDLDANGILDACEYSPLEVPRFGVLTNNEALVSLSPPGPSMGQPYRLRVDHETFLPGAITDIVFVGTVLVDIPLPPFGSLLLPLEGTLSASAAAGEPIEFPMPFNSVLFGLPFSFQGTSIGVVDGLPAIELTNAIDVLVGAWEV
ncbi:MAG: hypothetical protein AAFZ65_02395, partial [Planctomycetota bacterium]